MPHRWVLNWPTTNESLRTLVSGKQNTLIICTAVIVSGHLIRVAIILGFLPIAIIDRTYDHAVKICHQVFLFFLELWNFCFQSARYSNMGQLLKCLPIPLSFPDRVKLWDHMTQIVIRTCQLCVNKQTIDLMEVNI